VVAAMQLAERRRGGQHLLHRLRRPQVQRPSSHRWWRTATAPTIASRPCPATISAWSTAGPSLRRALRRQLGHSTYRLPAGAQACHRGAVGDGGDESRRLPPLQDAHDGGAMRSACPLALRRGVFGLLARLYPKADWAPRVFRAKTTFQAIAATRWRPTSTPWAWCATRCSAVQRLQARAAGLVQRDLPRARSAPAPTTRWR
jgi:hypothetical protein